MAKTNPSFDRMTAGYLFPEIGKRIRAFSAAHPGVKIMRLGIGDTTEPLPPSVIRGLAAGVDKLSRRETYTGYQDDSSGVPALKEALARRYVERYKAVISSSEIFVSDGAKPDSANIQSIFSLESTVAFQDPAYPVYVDSNLIAGRRDFVYMPCTEENGFFPAPPGGKTDLIYLCSPNNPTGAVGTRDQLKTFVDYALSHRAVIIYDAAYASYIADPSLPRTIYEVEGARKCAIEINSFSKEAGFTGVRLGWTVVPQDLVCEGAEPGKLNRLWARRQNTMFNGASNIVQEGGLAVLSPQGQEECRKVIDYYMGNARLVRQGLEKAGFKVYGGVNAPFLWMKTPGKMKSWDFFDKLLSEAGVVCTPGSGFGPSGEGFVRLSAFGGRENIQQALDGILKNLKI